MFKNYQKFNNSCMLTTQIVKINNFIFLNTLICKYPIKYYNNYSLDIRLNFTF